MDCKRVWFLLKKYILTKNSHGKNELLTEMMRLEIEEVERDKEHDKNE